MDIVTVDLDSTLADTRHRQAMLAGGPPTDWRAYAMACSGDSPVPGVVELVRLLSCMFRIWIVSARHADALEQTRGWLVLHGVPFDGIVLDDVGWRGSHAEYKLRRVEELENRLGRRVVLHIDDWDEVGDLFAAHGRAAVVVSPPLAVGQLA